MIIIYWYDNKQQTSNHKTLGDMELNEAMHVMKELRKNDWISHVTYSCEPENCTSLMGVDITDDTYEWKKRR